MGLVLVPSGAISLRQYRKRIKTAFVATHPECGSVFIILVLPILISVISAWISRWIMNRTDTAKIQAQAYEELLASSPSYQATLTSISSRTRTPSGPER